MTTTAISWLCATTFLLGYLAGETVRLIQTIRAYRRDKARTRDAQALKDALRSFPAHDREVAAEATIAELREESRPHLRVVARRP